MGCRGLQGYWIPVSGAVARRHFDVGIGCFVFGSVSLAFQSVLLGVGALVFHWWGKNGSFLRLREVFAVDFVGFALAAVGAVVLAFAGGLLFRAFSLAIFLPLFLAFSCASPPLLLSPFLPCFSLFFYLFAVSF